MKYRTRTPRRTATQCPNPETATSASPTCAKWVAVTEENLVARTSGRARLPDSLDLSRRRRIDDQVTKRLDRRHVGIPKHAVGFHQHGHLAAVAATLIGDPTEMKNTVHRPVGHLGGELVGEQVERGERQRIEDWSRWRIAQIRRQTVSEARHSRANAGLRVIPAEQRAYLEADSPQ